MNDPDDLLTDELLAEALAPLRAVAPPQELRDANMAAVQQALTSQLRPAWWQRSVSVPVPLAIAASLAFVVTTSVLLKTWIVSEKIPQHTLGPVVQIVDNAGSEFDEQLEPAWSVTRSYIHSIESLSNAKVAWTTDTEEKRDDS